MTCPELPRESGWSQEKNLGIQEDHLLQLLMIQDPSFLHISAKKKNSLSEWGKLRPVLQDIGVLFGLLRKSTFPKMYILPDEGQGRSFLHLQLCLVGWTWYIKGP